MMRAAALFRVSGNMLFACVWRYEQICPFKNLPCLLSLTFNKGVQDLDELYEHIKANFPELANKYGMKNLTEFVSEVMSNSEFQEQLNAIPYKRSNIFTEFARAILRMLGISPTDNFTALAYAMVSTESILTEGRKLEETNPPPATAALGKSSDVTGLKQTEPEKTHSKATFEESMKAIKENTNKKIRLE